MKSIFTSGLISTISITCATSLHGATVVSPTAVITNSMGNFNPLYGIDNLINSSVTVPFVSGVTDFAEYQTAAVGSTDSGDSWTATSGAGLGMITLDLGQEYSLKAMLIWNEVAGGPGRGVKDFRVEIDDNVDFTSPTQIYSSSLANVPQLQVRGGIAYVENPALPVISRYVRFEILSTHGNSTTPSFKEIAFAVDPVPEPSSALLVLVSAGAAVARRRRCPVG